eukprot:10651784-Alexandrium_andersonii.AAC.1
MPGGPSKRACQSSVPPLAMCERISPLGGLPRQPSNRLRPCLVQISLRGGEDGARRGGQGGER